MKLKVYHGIKNKYFHTFDHICEYDLNFTNITNNESVNFTISDKSMGMYELNKNYHLLEKEVLNLIK